LQQLWNREDAKGAKIVAKKHGEYPLRSLCLCGFNDVTASDSDQETIERQNQSRLTLTTQSRDRSFVRISHLASRISHLASRISHLWIVSSIGR
jgi:hypothetical protein